MAEPYKFGQAFSQAFLASQERKFQKEQAAQEQRAIMARLTEELTARREIATDDREHAMNALKKQLAHAANEGLLNRAQGKDFHQDNLGMNLLQALLGYETAQDQIDVSRTYAGIAQSKFDWEKERAAQAAEAFSNTIGGLQLWNTGAGMPDPADWKSYNPTVAERGFAGLGTLVPGASAIGAILFPKAYDRTPAGADEALDATDLTANLTRNFAAEAARNPAGAAAIAPSLAAMSGPLSAYAQNVMASGDPTKASQARAAYQATLMNLMFGLGGAQAPYNAWTAPRPPEGQ